MGETDAAPRRARGLALGATAVLLASYALLAFARLYRPDPADGMSGLETPLAWASLMGTTFAPHAGIGLAIALLALAAARRWRVVLLGLPLVGLALGPRVMTYAPAPGAPDGPALLVLSANLLGGSTSDIDLLAQIETHRPHLILLQEVQPGSMERLERALGDRYRHVAAPRDNLFGEAIFSTLPFTREGAVITPSYGRDQPQLMAWVEWNGGELCLLNVHLPPPTGREMTAWQARLAWELDRAVEVQRDAGLPVIVAGDFNSPWGAHPLDGLRALGFREAHLAAGAGPGSTWPAHGPFSLAPGIRIDHVAYSRGLECAEAWVGAETASDHRPNFASFLPE